MVKSPKWNAPLMQERDGTRSRVVSSIDTTTPTRGGGTPRGQSTIELISIVAVAIIILAVLVDFTANQVSYLQKQQGVKTAELAIQSLISAANDLYTQGPGATRYVQLTWPFGVESNGTGIQGHSIVVNVFGTTVSGTAIPSLTGTLPINSGLQNIRVRAFDGFVMIGEMDVSANPTSILSSVARNSFADTNIILTSGSAENATISITKSWSHSDVNLNITPTSGTLTAGSTFSFDANLLANASAVGTYTGTITVTATFPSSVQTLVIPVQANVNAGNSSLLVAFPSSISLSTFGIDTNSTTFQLCNVGTTEMKNISITASSGAPGTWLAPISPITTLSAQSCQNVDVNVSVPTDSISPYSGSLTISDYTGANSTNVPVTINVLGMSSVFRWDWSPAYKSVQSIFDFGLANVGRKPITITHVTLQDWWDCDQQLSLWNSLVVDNTSRFIGALPDGNRADVTDFNMPILTAYTDNYLSFSDNIQDDNELFTAVVDFSDGTQYTSATFGAATGVQVQYIQGSCALDITPPSKISDLTLVPGPEPESMVLSFTMPGDDGNIGRIFDLNMRIADFSLDSMADFNAATYLDYTGPAQYPTGGARYTQTIYNYDAGKHWSLAIRTKDESGNLSAISTVAVEKSWNEYRFSGNDFNITNFAQTFGTATPTDQYDVNKFTIHSILGEDTLSKRLALAVNDDSNSSNGWYIVFDMNETDINYYAIWDDVNPLGAGLTLSTPDYNRVVSWPIQNSINLLSAVDFPTEFRYSGTEVDIQTPLTLHVIETTNISDFNVSFDMLVLIAGFCEDACFP